VEGAQEENAVSFEAKLGRAAFGRRAHAAIV
jgi:hypothetical protein